MTVNTHTHTYTAVIMTFFRLTVDLQRVSKLQGRFWRLLEQFLRALFASTHTHLLE